MRHPAIAITLALLFPLHIAAQDAALSIEECIGLALAHNRQLAASAMQTMGARYQAKSVRANFFPSLTAQGTALYSDANGSLGIAGGNLPTFLASGTPDGGFAYFPGTSIDYKVGAIFMAGAQLQQPIYTGGKLRAAYRMHTIAARMARLGETLTAQDVVVQTAEAYINVVKAREMLTVAQKYNETLDRLRQDVENACRHGLTPRNDALKVQVKLNESELGIRRAENALRLATMNLCHHIGRPLASQTEITGDLPNTEESAATTYPDITLRPEHELLADQTALSTQQARLARSDQLPQIGVSGNYSYIHGMRVNGSNLFDKGYFAAMLNVSLPLYHFGERANRVKAAKAKQAQALLEQEELDEKMRLELCAACNNLEEARLEAELTARSLEQATENMRVSRSHYDAGLETLSSHLEAQALWQQAYETHIEAQCQRYLSHIQYLKASGQLPALFPTGR